MQDHLAALGPQRWGWHLADPTPVFDCYGFRLIIICRQERRSTSSANNEDCLQRANATPYRDISRTTNLPQPLLAQAYRPHLLRRLSRQCLRPCDDDSLLPRPLCPGGLWPPPLLACLRLLCLLEKRPRHAPRTQGLATRHRPAPHLQRALRNRASRRGRLAIRLPARTARRSSP